MQLIHLQNNNINSKFGYRLPNKVFHDIRNIPSMTCAKCGQKMLSLQEYEQCMSKIYLTSKQVLNSKLLEPFKETHIYQSLQKLAQKYPKTPFFKLLDIKTLPTEDLQEGIQLATLSKNFVISSAQGIKKLNKIKTILPNFEQKLLQKLEEYSASYPDDTFLEILNRSEIFHENFVNSKSLNMNYQKAFNKKIKAITKLARPLSENEKLQLKALNITAGNIAATQRFDKNLRKNLIMQNYKGFLSSIKDENLKKALLEEIQTIPLKDANISGKLLHLAGKSNVEIFDNFYRSCTATFEHIIPHSHKGTKVQENGLCFCTSCNRNRGNLPYEILIDTYSDFVSNIQKQINKVSLFIRTGHLKGYEEYPQRVKQTLLSATNQRFNLNIKKYLTEQIKKLQLQIQDTFEQITNTGKRKNIITDQLQTTEQSISQTEETLKLLKQEKQILNIQHNAEIRAETKAQQKLLIQQQFLEKLQEELSKQ